MGSLTCTYFGARACALQLTENKLVLSKHWLQISTEIALVETVLIGNMKLLNKDKYSLHHKNSYFFMGCTAFLPTKII